MSFQFMILRQLGSGGNGDVFLAQQYDTGAYIVVKYLREWQLQAYRELFEQQARLLARGICGWVPVLGWNFAAQPPFYVMPYFDGGTLTQYAGRFNDYQLQNIAVKLAHPLANLHAAYEMSGDFKPDNVFLTRNGEVQVGDPIGNANILMRLFGNNRGGTPGYCAPEIMAGRPISKVGDVFSYGATLYHLQTGRRPQPGQRLDLIAQGHRNAPKIREIIAACCQLVPAARPTMPEVLRLLAGEKWVDIQAERARRQEFVTAACFIGVAVLGAAALSA